jgi:DNA repair protein RadC
MNTDTDTDAYTLTLDSTPATKPTRKTPPLHIGLKVEAALMQVRENTETVLRDPPSCYAELADLGQLAQEAFVILTVTAKNKMIARHLCTLGLLDTTPVHPREVFRPAIQDSAAAVILGHNHPSGDPTPSVEDLRITRQLIEAGRILGVRVIDHLIIGRPKDGAPGFLSLREKGLVEFAN